MGEGPNHRGGGQGDGLLAKGEAGRIGSGQPAARHGGGIALGTGDLSCGKEPLAAAKLQGGVEQLGGFQEGVAVHHPEAHEFGLLQARDQPQHPLLLPPFEVGLESHQVPELAVLVFLAQLHHRIGPVGPADIPVIDVAPAGIPKANGLQGPVAHGVFAAAGQLFDR